MEKEYEQSKELARRYIFPEGSKKELGGIAINITSMWDSIDRANEIIRQSKEHEVYLASPIDKARD